MTRSSNNLGSRANVSFAVQAGGLAATVEFADGKLARHPRRSGRSRLHAAGARAGMGALSAGGTAGAVSPCARDEAARAGVLRGRRRAKTPPVRASRAPLARARALGGQRARRGGAAPGRTGGGSGDGQRGTHYRPLRLDRDRGTQASHLFRAGGPRARPPVPAYGRRGHAAVPPPDERRGAAARLAHDGFRPALAWQEPAAGRGRPGRVAAHDGPLRGVHRRRHRRARSRAPGVDGFLDGRADLPGDGASLGRCARRRHRVRGVRQNHGPRGAFCQARALQPGARGAGMDLRPHVAHHAARASDRDLVGVLAGRLRAFLRRHRVLRPRLGCARARAAHRHEPLPGRHADR